MSSNLRTSPVREAVARLQHHFNQLHDDALQRKREALKRGANLELDRIDRELDELHRDFTEIRRRIL
jgi:hypothetical protein